MLTSDFGRRGGGALRCADHRCRKAGDDFLATVREDQKPGAHLDPTEASLAEKLVCLGTTPSVALFNARNRQCARAGGAIPFLTTERGARNAHRFDAPSNLASRVIRPCGRRETDVAVR